ncbi:MAG: hypothetical protein CMI53_02245 [Parcubacteria group bacterium]|nr:hypothetical protein [Parcubacteria group bacterium]|tara:strand:+ start:3206 stop:3472 length:267 start_codon:yes stop_codon:yes gene_type:complete
MSEADLDKLNNSYFISGKIKQFKDKDAIIETADGQKLTWPIKNLPEDIAVGKKVRLVLSTADTDQKEREVLAKTILNQILKQDRKSKE